MKILVTGANGYLGSGVVRQLLDDGCEVVAACRSDVDCVDCRAEIVRCDAFAVENPFEFFGKPDALLHMAWRNGFVHNARSHIEDLPAHYAFIRRAAESGIRQIAVMGSMHEVGFFEGSIKSDTPTHPQSLYGISKDALRNLTELVCKENSAVFQWLRGYYIVGNTQKGSSIFSKITEAEKNGQEKFPFTSGQNQWDFIDYDAFCRQTAAAVEQTEITGIINICSGFPEKLADRVERFIAESGYHLSLDYGKFPDRPYDSKAVWGDNSAITEILKKRG